MKRHVWSQTEDEVLRALYAEYSAEECAAALKLGIDQVIRRAKRLGLRKSPSWLSQRARERNLEPTNRNRFTRFHAQQKPWNKGMKGLQIGGTETRFQRGQVPHSWRPVGYEVVRDGVLWRKVTDTHRGSQARFNFRSVAVLVWEEANGPVPAGLVVAFKPGLATTVASEITADRLELITRQQLMARNTIARYPPELRSAMSLVRRLRRVITDQEQSK